MKRLIFGVLLVLFCFVSWSSEPLPDIYIVNGRVSMSVETYKQLLINQGILEQNSLKLSMLFSEWSNEIPKWNEIIQNSLMISIDSGKIEENAMKTIESLQILTNDNKEDSQNALTLTETAREDSKKIEDSLKQKTVNIWIERISIGAGCFIIGVAVASIVFLFV